MNPRESRIMEGKQTGVLFIDFAKGPPLTVLKYRSNVHELLMKGQIRHNSLFANIHKPTRYVRSL